MNRITHHRKFLGGRLLLLLTLLLSTTALTSYAGNDRRVDYTGTQEIDISVGLPSGPMFRDLTGLGHAFIGVDNAFGGFFDAIFGTDLGSSENTLKVGEGSMMLPTFRAEYGYNILSWLNLGGGVNYSYGRWPMVYYDSGAHAWDVGVHYTNITFNVKFYWLNRKWVRMYSGVGLGIGLVSSNNAATDASEAATYSTDVVPAFDIRLIGLTVGQKLYGRFEVGTTYGIVTAGIGYRF